MRKIIPTLEICMSLRARAQRSIQQHVLGYGNFINLAGRASIATLSELTRVLAMVPDHHVLIAPVRFHYTLLLDGACISMIFALGFQRSTFRRQ